MPRQCVPGPLFSLEGLGTRLDAILLLNVHAYNQSAAFSNSLSALGQVLLVQHSASNFVAS